MTAPERTSPIPEDAFAQAMHAFTPFERAPHLAVAVSGGADSMALAVLAHRWAAQRRGRISALIVDHGLRKESADEAAITSARLQALGIRTHLLHWQGTKPANGIQAAARRARYALLDDWCRRHGVLHLLVAHHADDQAETFMMRLRRGSGPDGLAAMSPVRMFSACRVLRPLLDFPKARLRATLEACGIEWVEDPSNANPKYARTSVRRELAENGNDIDGIVIATQRFARARQALETETARWLSHHAVVFATGYMEVPVEALQCADAEIRLRVLSRMARSIGGNAYAPDIAAVERLAARLVRGQGATLGGARFDPGAGRLLVSREARNLPEKQELPSGLSHWDGRFVISATDEAAGVQVLPWSENLGLNWPKSARPAWYSALPARVRRGLPVLECAGGYHAPEPGCIENIGISVRFAPTMPLSSGGFTVA